MMLKTKRLIIRKLTLEDAPFFYDLLNDKDWIRFIGDRNIKTLKDSEDYLKNRIIPSYKNWGFGFYAVDKQTTQKTIGISGFVKREELEFPDVGFAFLPDGRGKGYAFEATNELMKYGKEVLKFETILGIANNDNKKSHSLLDKLGLSYIKQVKLYEEEDKISLFST